MTPARIEETLALLPRGSQLYYPDTGVAPYELLGRRHAQAVMDPRYAWAFTMEFVKRRLPLPAGVGEDYLVAAHQHQLGHRYDRDLMLALNFREAGWNNLKAALQAGLADRQATFDYLASRLGVTTRAVELYERLFFAVRDRFEDLRLYAPAVAPLTQSVFLSPSHVRDMPPEELMMFNSVYRKQGAMGAFEVLGLPPEEPNTSPDAARTRLIDGMFQDATRMERLGGGCVPSCPPIRNATPLMVAQESNPNQPTVTDDYKTGLGGLGLGPGDAIAYKLPLCFWLF